MDRNRLTLPHVCRFVLFLTIGLTLCSAPACVPVVTHGPWVEPGMSAGAVGAVSTQPATQREVRTGQSNVTPVVAPLAVFARYGWTPGEAGIPVPISAGVLVSAALPFSLVHPEVDVYAQLARTRSRTVAAGAGALVSRSYVTPYAQAGYRVREGLSIYTTQSVAVFRGGDRGPDATVWMPSVAVKGLGLHLFAQAGLGRERITRDSTRPVRFAMAGVVLDLRSRVGF